MTGIHSITLLTSPILFRNSRKTTMPPNGVNARSVSCNNTLCPPKIRVLSAIRPVYADRPASTSEFRLKSFTLPQHVEEVEKNHSNYGVDQSQEQVLLDLKYGGLTEQRPLQQPVKELVKQVKDKTENEPYESVLDVELHADGRREVTDERLADAVHSERLLEERI